MKKKLIIASMSALLATGIFGYSAVLADQEVDNGVYYTTEDTVAEFEVEYVDTTDLEEGVENVVQEGVNGTKTVTYKEVYDNGNMVSKEAVSEGILTAPVKKVIHRGVKPEPVVEVAQNTAPPVESGVIFQATAYTWTGNPTATGTVARVGVIAVDPRVIPLGTKVYLQYTDGTPIGYATAEDTGGAIKGNIIDIYMDSYNECIQFGRRNVVVTIVE